MSAVCNTWDARFLLLCNVIASWSEDPSRKVGCVIVGPANEIRSTGYNGLPRGVNPEHPNRHSRDDGEKYLWYEHAERNAIYNAVRSGVPVDGCSIYVNSFPCSDCTRAIIQSGIATLNTYSFDRDDPKFGAHFSVAEEMLRETGVATRLFARNDPKIIEAQQVFVDASAPESNLFR